LPCVGGGYARYIGRMISGDELAAALRRLDPRDWEVLDLSLRRRVPDEALAKMFGSQPAEVARRRAAAIEHLADTLGIQRGEDLGAVLKALLDAETWEAAGNGQNQGEAWQGFGEPEEAPDHDEEEPPEDQEVRPPARGTRPTDRDLRATERAVRSAQQKTSEAARLFRLTPAPDPLVEPVPLAEAEAELPREAEEPAAEEHEEAAAEEEPAPEPAEPEEVAAAEEPEQPDEPAEVAAADEPEPASSPGEPAERDAPAPVATAAPAAAASATAQGNGAPTEPVLEMLSGARKEPARERFRTPALWGLLGGLGVAALIGAGWIGATAFNGDDSKNSSGGGGDTRRFLPAAGGPLAAPFPSDPQTTSCYSTAYVRRPVELYSRPGGRRKLKLPASTEWGSPRVLSVVRRRGDWLAVLAPELKNGEMGWMNIAGASRLDCVRWSVHVDLSRRKLYVRRDGHTVKKFTVAIGGKGHPTPKGRFAVTDKLRVADKGSPYGCCVLALTGHQNKLPPDWPGGDRLAVHATTDLSSIGKPVSLGCMRGNPKNVRWLIGTMPLGAPVFIRS
jgi:L,D-transpeptidase catalytic domain